MLKIKATNLMGITITEELEMVYREYGLWDDDKLDEKAIELKKAILIIFDYLENQGFILEKVDDDK